MRRTQARRSARERWGPALLALAGGAAAALANPPFGLLPGLFGYAAVLLALEAPARGRFWPAFRRGWAAGTGYLAVSTLWVTEPFLIDAAAHAWQIPFALLWCGAGIGLLWGVGGVLHRLLRPAGLGVGPGALLAFAAAFGAAEWLRGHLFTGFPWDIAGETFRAGSPLSQGAALVGAYGLTPLVFALGGSPALLRGRGPGRIATLAAAAAALGALGLWGEARLRAAPPPPIYAPRVRVVQPDLPEPQGWPPGLFEARLDRYLRLTRTAYSRRPADLVIWPEGALPAPLGDLLGPASAVPQLMAGALRPGQRLVFGANRTEPGPGGKPRYFNTLAAVTPAPGGGVTLEGVYDKHHLVPFGEYLPLRWLFDPLGFGKVIDVPGDFSAGPPPQPLRVGGVTVQPLICYEALFPDLARGDGRRARLLLNISDDAWFGRWMGPWQHLNLASHRAIEEGLPMVRATPTGVSAVIDAYGRPAALLAPGAEGVIDAAVPPPAPGTLYSSVRSLAFWSVEAAATLGCLLLLARARRASALASERRRA